MGRGRRRSPGGSAARSGTRSRPGRRCPGRREGAPNIVLLVLDDVGFAQPSPFGGGCEMPTLERLAARGLRYTNFHATPLCSPTRACLLSGRNHHAVGVGALVELSMGFPGYHGMAGPDQAFLPAILRDAGYNTFAVGKWHLSPPSETSSAGPYRTWPLGRGFERYYGFMGGDTSQWFPDLVQDNTPIAPPATPEEGYHLNADLADHAIQMIKDAHVAAPDKPFFLYYATGAGHAPHHVEPEWVEPYRGRFDQGWDAYRAEVFDRQVAAGIVPGHARLSERDPDVPAWDDLDADSRRMFARQMEVYAGFLTQTDHHVGPRPRLRRAPGRARQHDRRRRLRQRRQRRGRAGGHLQRVAVLQLRARAPRRQPPPLRRVGRGRHVPALLVGVDLGRHHPVPPVEAGDVPGRRQRAVHRLVAGRHRRPRRGPPPVRPRHRHPADPAGRGGHPDARGGRGRAAAADPRGQPGRVVHRRRRTGAAGRRSTSRCTPTAPSTTTGGGPCARSPDRAWPRPPSGGVTSGSPS